MMQLNTIYVIPIFTKSIICFFIPELQLHMWWSDPPGGHVCLSRPPMASGDFEYIFWDIPPLLGDPQTHFCLLRGPEPSKNPKMVKNVKNDWFWPKNGLKSGKKWVFRSHMASKLPEGCISTIWSDMDPLIGILTHFCLQKWWFLTIFDDFHQK